MRLIIFVSVYFLMQTTTVFANNSTCDYLKPDQKVTDILDLKVKGEVNKIDFNKNRITISHGCIDHLDMPKMKMTYSLFGESLINYAVESGIQKGSKIEFVADRIDGRYYIIYLRISSDDNRVFPLNFTN